MQRESELVNSLLINQTLFVLSRMDAAISRAVYLPRYLSELLLSPTRITARAIKKGMAAIIMGGDLKSLVESLTVAFCLNRVHR